MSSEARDPVEDAADARDAASAKFTVLHEGSLIPVTKMYDALHNETDNPLHAFVCVACMGPEQWIAIPVTPGEIAPRRSRCLI